jgi:hypothetical protein
MTTTPVPVPPPLPPPGFVKPSHGYGMLRPPWQPGQAGNPQNKNQLFSQCQKLCSERSPEAADKMHRLMSCGDERIEFMAAAWIYERAWGKPKEFDSNDLAAPRMVLDTSRLTPEQRAVLLEITRSGAVRPADPEPTDAQHDAQSSSDDAAATPHGTINGTATEEPPLSFVRSRQAVGARG